MADSGHHVENDSYTEIFEGRMKTRHIGEGGISDPAVRSGSGPQFTPMPAPHLRSTCVFVFVCLYLSDLLHCRISLFN